jgi:hypothetical protein
MARVGKRTWATWIGSGLALGCLIAACGGGGGDDESGTVPIGAACAAGACQSGLSCLTSAVTGADVCGKRCSTDADCAGFDFDQCLACSGSTSQCVPRGARCSGSSGGGTGGSSSGGGTHGLAESCSSDEDCESGLRCMRRFGNTSNPLTCLKPCASHASCSALPMGYTNCWSCNDDVWGEATAQTAHCVNVGACNGTVGGGDACSECLASCRGLSSCCTGTGCICDDEC